MKWKHFKRTIVKMNKKYNAKNLMQSVILVFLMCGSLPLVAMQQEDLQMREPASVTQEQLAELHMRLQNAMQVVGISESDVLVRCHGIEKKMNLLLCKLGGSVELEREEQVLPDVLLDRNAITMITTEQNLRSELMFLKKKYSHFTQKVFLSIANQLEMIENYYYDLLVIDQQQIRSFYNMLKAEMIDMESFLDRSTLTRIKAWLALFCFHMLDARALHGYAEEAVVLADGSPANPLVWEVVALSAMVEGNDVLAYEYFRRAAELTVDLKIQAEAAGIVGECYMEGKCVSRDVVAGLEYLLKASQQAGRKRIKNNAINTRKDTRNALLWHEAKKFAKVTLPIYLIRELLTLLKLAESIHKM